MPLAVPVMGFIPSWLHSWRRMRRAAHEALTKRAVQNYYPIQTKEATILASSILSSSAGLDLGKQFYRLAASTILSIVYDYPTLHSNNDPILKKVEDYVLHSSQAASPGTFYVDMFPWMMYIPERSWIYFIVSLYTDIRPNKIREVEAGRFSTIQRTLCAVQRPSRSCPS